MYSECLPRYYTLYGVMNYLGEKIPDHLVLCMAMSVLPIKETLNLDLKKLFALNVFMKELSIIN